MRYSDLIAMLLIQQSMCQFKEIEVETTTDSEGSLSPECSVQSYELNLSEFLTDSKIVYPAIADIGVCQGSCPSEPSSEILNKYHFYRNESEDSRGPCCIPTEFETICVFVNNGGKHKIIRLDNVKVTKCDCF